MDFFKIIEEYCENQLSPEDKALFEREMLINEALKKAVSQYKHSRKMSEALLQMDIFESIENAKNNPPETLSTLNKTKSLPKSNMKMYWLIGLLGIVAILIYLMISKNSKTDNQVPQTQQFVQVYTEPIWPVVRSGEDTLLQKAMFLFLQKDNVETAKSLILKDTLISEEMRNYWVAEMYLKKGLMDSVLVYLPEILSGHSKQERLDFISNYLKSQK